MRFVLILFAILLIAPKNAMAGVNVVTSISPLALLVKDLGGDHVAVTSLVPNAGSIHHYSMRVSDRVAVDRADLVVLVGAGLEPFLGKLQGLDAQKITRLDQLPNIVSLDNNANDSNDEGHSHDAAIDPHLWLNPTNVELLADAIVKKLSELLPSEATQFQQRLKAFKIQQQQALVSVNLNKTRSYFAYHNSFAYLLSHYGIGLQGVLTNANESRMGMRSLYKVKQAVQATDNACVLVQQSTKKLSEKILGDVSFAEIDVLAGQRQYSSYHEYLTAMLKAIDDC